MIPIYFFILDMFFNFCYFLCNLFKLIYQFKFNFIYKYIHIFDFVGNSINFQYGGLKFAYVHMYISFFFIYKNVSYFLN